MMARHSATSIIVKARPAKRGREEHRTSNIEHPTSNDAGAPDIRRSVFEI
jgi:hypothetical protein